MIKKRFLEGKQPCQPVGFGNLIIDENSIKQEDCSRRKEARLISVKVEPDQNRMSFSETYPMADDEPGCSSSGNRGSSGIHSLEDLRRHIEKMNIENSVKKEAGDNGPDGNQKKLKIVMVFRSDRYLEATQMPNIDVLRNFKSM